jgi:hypothetical protein
VQAVDVHIMKNANHIVAGPPERHDHSNAIG